MAKYGIPDDDVYNFDEVGFMMGIIFAGMVVTTSDSRSKVKLAQPGNREWVTVTGVLLTVTVKAHGEVGVVWTGQLLRRVGLRTSETTSRRVVRQATLVVFGSGGSLVRQSCRSRTAASASTAVYGSKATSHPRWPVAGAPFSGLTVLSSISVSVSASIYKHHTLSIETNTFVHCGFVNLTAHGLFSQLF